MPRAPLAAKHNDSRRRNPFAATSIAWETCLAVDFLFYSKYNINCSSCHRTKSHSTDERTPPHETRPCLSRHHLRHHLRLRLSRGVPHRPRHRPLRERVPLARPRLHGRRGAHHVLPRPGRGAHAPGDARGVPQLRAETSAMATIAALVRCGVVRPASVRDRWGRRVLPRLPRRLRPEHDLLLRRPTRGRRR